MAAAVELKGDWSSAEFRRLAAKAKDANQARRLLALAAIRDGKTRAEAARIGGMDRQTLRDWVHAINAKGPDGLINRKAPGRKPKLTAEQRDEVRTIVETGPDPEVDGVVRWRCIDLRGITVGRSTERWRRSGSERFPRRPSRGATSVLRSGGGGTVHPASTCGAGPGALAGRPRPRRKGRPGPYGR